MKSLESLFPVTSRLIRGKFSNDRARREGGEKKSLKATDGTAGVISM